jgi:hypothetical protein
MAKITEITNKWDLVHKFTDQHWKTISAKLLRFHGDHFYMVEIERPSSTSRATKFTYPWIIERLGVKASNPDWCSDARNGIYFIKEYDIALQFYLTFGSETFA